MVYAQNTTILQEMELSISRECGSPVAEFGSNFVLRFRHAIAGDDGHFENIVM